MGNGKEKKEKDTLLYYIRGKFSGEDGKDICYEREGNKCFGEGIAEKNRGFNGSLTEFKRELNRKYGGILTGIRWELNRIQTLTLLMQLGRHLFQGRK
ncbi:hypothetical protein ACRFAY_18075 [Bacteroides hominis]|uniref:hypothetical protein n=1 Tax=Bacteroides TaxID=816 RepID=UPI0013050963|nr:MULTISPECIES: hypothetical protein [Bacteroides]MCC2235528.1 hypothetical protein [Bacteroides hominis (ex Afrizal et al. 2022)]MCE8559846.1 hypothetical protein [Bacteroides fragilis]MCY6328740.1 hypothetical protein [Bacteroides fragilis]